MQLGHAKPILKIKSNLETVLRYSDAREKGRSGFLRRRSNLRTAAMVSGFAVVLLVLATLAPIYNNSDITEAAAGNAISSNLVMNVTSNTAQVDLSVSKVNGTFVSSTSNIEFKIGTNNYTGYTLNFDSIDNNTTLKSSTGATLSSIDSATTNAQFSADTAVAGTVYNGKWGYLPSTYYEENETKPNTSYRPAPTVDGATLAKTTSANAATIELAIADANVDKYTIGVGARADYSQTSGTYTGSFLLTAVSNSVNYSISYADNTGDTSVKNLPTTQSSSTSASSITLSNTIPTRSYYTFKAWCLGTVSDSGKTCAGTEYAVGAQFGINQTTENNSTLYAVWTPNKYSITIRPTDGVASVSLNGTNCTNTNGCIVSDLNYAQSYALTASLSSGYSFSSWGNSNGTSSTGTIANASSNSTTFTVGTGSTILTASATAGSHSLTVTFENSGVSSVGVYDGSTLVKTVTSSDKTVSNLSTNKTYTLKPNFASNYESATWLKTDSYGQIAYTMGAGDGAVSVTGNSSAPGNCSDAGTCMQTFTIDSCTTSGVTVTDSRDGKTYTVAKLADGKCWMLDNLALDLVSNKDNLTSDTTNASDAQLGYLKNGGGSTSDQYPTSGLINWPAGTSNNYSYSVPYQKTGYETTTGSGGYAAGKYGTYYNYCAASAGTYCYGNGTSAGSPSGDASADICPKGWRMPTGNTSGEYQALYNKYNNYNTFVAALHTPLSGSYSNGSAGAQGSYGRFWSSTYYNASNMYLLRLGTSDVNPADAYDRGYGLSVRCVLK